MMSLPDKDTVLQNSCYFTYICKVIINFSFQIPENCEKYCWKVEYIACNIAVNIASNIDSNILPATLTGILLDVDACVSHTVQTSCWKVAPCGWVNNTVVSNIASNFARCGYPFRNEQW